MTHHAALNPHLLVQHNSFRTEFKFHLLLEAVFICFHLQRLSEVCPLCISKAPYSSLSYVTLYTCYWFIYISYHHHSPHTHIRVTCWDPWKQDSADHQHRHIFYPSMCLKLKYIVYKYPLNEWMTGKYQKWVKDFPITKVNFGSRRDLINHPTQHPLF